MSDPRSSARAAGPAAPSRRTDAIAVALGYDPEGGRAPTVLASGRGTVAEQILSIAFAQGVKVREDADLAQILAAVEVDSEIPLEALAAVAEILSYVYRANGRLAGRSDPAPPPHDPPVPQDPPADGAAHDDPTHRSGPP
ncbi:EscU/YscU/HrcU family type III secretion system export apparatus switch protein [Roseospira navarrensis]|uniref:Flagellar protein FhlB n=1 Tax=Roseospira navarrensis TaxID=140058 RepID=A0A7X2D219_9PROT|nr:EscU/YscU/HrcU family type III secretion system export apparatus switch protein [Roseospira navarrensis]MQX35226.1 flagellar protein FhlB [Roseospira navarrensis]